MSTEARAWIWLTPVVLFVIIVSFIAAEIFYPLWQPPTPTLAPTPVETIPSKDDQFSPPISTSFLQQVYATETADRSLLSINVTETTSPLLSPTAETTQTGAEDLSLLTTTPSPIPAPTESPKATQSPSTPTIIPTLEPEGVVVAPDGINLRAGPGLIYNPPINFLSEDEPLNILGQVADGEWIKVRAIEKGVEGWVSTDPRLVKINLTLDNVPVVSAAMLPTPSASPTPDLPNYSAPIPTAPDNGSGSYGTFPPLTWTWDDTLADDEYFEVRIWHESITDYHPALGWVKVPPFDFNISQEREGKYYWTVTVVKGQNAKLKDWIIQSGWPYQMWDGDLVAELSLESEQRFFFYTPASGGSSGGQTSISNSKPDGGTGIDDN